MAELAVHGLQFLVDRLQLFLGGLQLLVRGLQLLVDRLIFLVGGLQLLVGAFQLLDRRLETLARKAQFALQLLHVLVALQAKVGAGFVAVLAPDLAVLQHDHEILRDALRAGHRLDGDRDAQRLDRAFHLEVVGAGRGRFACGAVEQRAQVHAQIAMDQIEDVERGDPAHRFEEPAGTPGEMDDVELIVEDDIGRGKAFDDSLGPACDIRSRGRRPHGGRRSARGGARAEREIRKGSCQRLQPLEDAVPPIDRGEQTGVTGNVLGGAEEQEALGPQREMEERNQAVLQFRIEIYQ